MSDEICPFRALKTSTYNTSLNEIESGVFIHLSQTNQKTLIFGRMGCRLSFPHATIMTLCIGISPICIIIDNPCSGILSIKTPIIISPVLIMVITPMKIFIYKNVPRPYIILLSFTSDKKTKRENKNGWLGYMLDWNLDLFLY